MTPRSRKPVMLLTALGNGDKQQNSSFVEQPDQTSQPAGIRQLEPPVLHSEDATSLGGYADILRRQQHFVNNNLLTSRQRLSSSSNSNSNSTEQELEPSMDTKPLNALSSDFK